VPTYVLEKEKLVACQIWEVRRYGKTFMPFLARNSCTHKVEWAGELSWCRNQSPMRHFSSCFRWTPSHRRREHLNRNVVHIFTLGKNSHCTIPWMSKKEWKISMHFRLELTCLAFFWLYSWTHISSPVMNLQGNCSRHSAEEAWIVLQTFHVQIFCQNDLLWFTWDSKLICLAGSDATVFMDEFLDPRFSHRCNSRSSALSAHVTPLLYLENQLNYRVVSSPKESFNTSKDPVAVLPSLMYTRSWLKSALLWWSRNSKGHSRQSHFTR